ncbi:nitrogen fixation protein NifW [Paraferrimonas sp. SM1919]|uniref:nitrogen fixation protein NifW n=1 Tax=Paraferrimonas sp. SM1919 TaxID=2662263 RepID=UPI0013D8D768|nr:nitrogen fixation protein NifW [Paraferrimonas sp. SM1919]
MTQSTLEIIASFNSIEQALDYFEIDYAQSFIDEYRQPLTKRFAGNVLIAKPDDWFAGRRALKNAYCRIQRGRLSKQTRQACRGCTTCQRR